jgi:rare lipoprotein A
MTDESRVTFGDRMTPHVRHPVFLIRASFLILISSFVLLSSCSSPPSTTLPGHPRVVATQHGLASIYADRRTASGEPYRANAFAAAHKTWPLRCLVRCTNTHTGRWVIVRINDRGPYIRGRIIDLTPAAASAIGLHRGQGICKVKIERLQ